MSQEPEALRLADVLDTKWTGVLILTRQAAAAELRRLHAECESLRKLADDRLEQMTADRQQALRWRDECESLRTDAELWRKWLPWMRRLRVKPFELGFDVIM